MDERDDEIEESVGYEADNLESEYNVTPWQVDGVVDYNKIVQDFGTRLITPEIIEKLQKFSGNVHPLLSRGFFFSHRDLDVGTWTRTEMEKISTFIPAEALLVMFIWVT